MSHKRYSILFGIFVVFSIAVSIGAEYLHIKAFKLTDPELYIILSKDVVQPQEELEISIFLSDNGEEVEREKLMCFDAHIYKDGNKVKGLVYGSNNVILSEVGLYTIKTALIDADSRLRTKDTSFEVRQAQENNGNNGNGGDDQGPVQNKDTTAPVITVANEGYINGQYTRVGFGLYLDIECADNVSGKENIDISIRSDIGSIMSDKTGRPYFISYLPGECKIEIEASDEAGNTAQKFLTVYVEPDYTYFAHYSRWIDLEEEFLPDTIIYGYQSVYFEGGANEHERSFQTAYGINFESDRSWEFETVLELLEIAESGYARIFILNNTIIITRDVISVFFEQTLMAQFNNEDSSIRLLITYDGGGNLKLVVNENNSIDLGPKPYESDLVFDFYNIKCFVKLNYL